MASPLFDMCSDMKRRRCRKEEYGVPRMSLDYRLTTISYLKMAIGGGSTARRVSKAATSQGQCYYKCCEISPHVCNVRKKVERDRSDPDFVLVTYKGQHLHELPGIADSRVM
eukprot:SM000227S07468  [mRNA]  locus=s227:123855:124529:+ [translate_table: standard]